MIRANTVCLAFALVLAGTAHAASHIHTWSGGGADTKWTTVGNWVGNSPPALGESTLATPVTVVFPAGFNSTMDIVGLVVDLIHFTGTGNTIKGTTALGISGS